MRYCTLATDYDGTLAAEGVVAKDTYRALERLRRSGWHLILVTGRELRDLMNAFPDFDVFESIVAENGAILYDTATQEQILLCEPPPEQFVTILARKNTTPLSMGLVIVATTREHEEGVRETIRELGLDVQIIFNKHNLMVLPTGVDKASGLTAALQRSNLSFQNTVGIGDAENDYAFLSKCELAVAVANAVSFLKDQVDLVTNAEQGGGVVELIHELLNERL
jgi:hydroxymethylpyrimidine pyrophosphatase-like HAD family hydrolase